MLNTIVVVTLTIGFIAWIWLANRDGRPIFKGKNKK